MRSKKFIVAIVSLCSMFMLSGLVGTIRAASSASSISGFMILNKEKIKLSYAYVDLANPEEPIVVMSDKPLPGDDLFAVLTDSYIRQKKLHAIVITISRSEKKLTEGINFIYFPGKQTHFIALGDKGILNLTKLDKDVISGTYKTPKPIADDYNGVTVSFDASFKVSTTGKSAELPLKKK